MHLLVALTPFHLVATACVLFAVAVGGLAVLVMQMRGGMRDSHDVSQFDRDRRRSLREHSWCFRWFEPLVVETEGVAWLEAIGNLPRIRRALDAGAHAMPWRGEELLGVFAVQGTIVSLVAALAFLCWVKSPMALVCCPLLFLGYVYWASSRLHRRAENRIRQVKRRLPFAVDLMALMIEAGASFRESLAAIVKECQDHPLGVELARLHRDVERGQVLHLALTKLQERLHDDDVNEMVFAVQKAEELGTPLSETFKNLADQMRMKRSQWAEKAAGQAQANITFPGIVVMCACLLIVLAPFAVQAYLQSPALF